MTDERRAAGFKRHAGLDDARERLLDAVVPHERVERRRVEAADGRVLAEDVTAARPVPHYDRAAMDGFAVRATDTYGASERSPAVLRTDDAVGPSTAVPVDTGSELPDGADAVVMVEHVDRHERDLEVRTAVTPGENVAPVGEDVQSDETVFAASHRLRPADLGLCKAVGRATVPVYDPPDVAVVPTGEELVGADPGPGQVVETNGLTVARCVERWGGTARYRDVVTDDEAALRAAIERDSDADIVVTTGGSSVGERDLVPDVVDELGEVLVHGVGLKPGHPVAFGVVEETPIVMLPGYPVSCLVTATQLLRPALKRAGHLPPVSFPTVEARLDGKVASEPGVRQYVRVRLERDGPRSRDPYATTDSAHGVDGSRSGRDGEDDPLPEAVPIRASGAGVLSSVTEADGWVVVPESLEGLDDGATVAVEQWSWSP